MNKGLKQIGFRNVGKIDKSKIINNYGIDEKTFEAVYKDVIRAIEETNKGIKGEIKTLVEDKILGHILDVKAKQDDTENSIKESVNEKLNELKADSSAFKTKILSEIEKNQSRIEKYCHECTYDLLTIYGELSRLTRIIDRIDATKDRELVAGKSCLQKAMFKEAEEFFDKAMTDLKLKCDAYFGKALAECRVQLLWDYEKDCEQVICHDYNVHIKQNVNYQFAIENADENQRNQYEEYAYRIEKVLKLVQGYAKNRNKFDVFICIKESDSNDDSKKTADFEWMKSNYNRLMGLINKNKEQRELKVFFSAIDCKKITGEEYEALVLYALKEAKCMLLVCSDESYLDTDWVKNEYTRFRSFWAQKNMEDRQIIIIYNGKRVNIPGRADLQDVNRADIAGENVTEEEKKNWFEQLAKDIRDRVDEGEEFLNPYSKYCPKCNEEYKGEDAHFCIRCKSALVGFEDYINGKYKEEKDKGRELQKSLSSKDAENKKLREDLRKNQEIEQEVDLLKQALAEKEEEKTREFLAKDLLHALEIKKLKEAIENKENGEGISLDEEGIRGFSFDTLKIKKLRARANDGDAEAQFQLGEYYNEKLKGKDCLNNADEIVRAEYWYKKASSNGHKEAKYKLGFIYCFILDERHKGENLLMSLADEGYLKAQYALANLYLLRERVNRFQGSVQIWPQNFYEFEGYISKNLDFLSNKDKAIDLLKKITEPIASAKSWKAKSEENKIRINASYMLCKLTGVKRDNNRRDIISKGAWAGDKESQEAVVKKNVINICWLELPLILFLIVGIVVLDCGHNERRVLGTVQNGFLIFLFVLSLLSLAIFTFMATWLLILRIKLKIKNGKYTWLWGLLICLTIVIYAFNFISMIVGTDVRSSYFNYDVNEDDTITVYLDYSFKNKKELVIPGKIDGHEVSAIGDSAFSYCSSLESIEIPSSVTSIGSYAFYNCSSLTSVEIPSSVTSIGSSAFYGCSSLTIYCEASSRPSGWNIFWNLDDCPVVWDYKSN